MNPTFSPRAANTESISTAIEQLAPESIQLQRPAMPEVQTYCTVIPYKGVIFGGNSKVNIGVITSVQAVQLNPTTFENNGDQIDLEQVTLNVYSAQFGFDAPDQAKGLDAQLLLASHLTKIEGSIQAAINAIITEANYGAPVVTVASSNWSASGIETLMESVPGRTALCLAPSYFVKTKPNDMPPGTQGTLRELSDLTSIGTNLKGFSARPEAVALIVGYPDVGPTSEVKQSKIRLPIGLDVMFSRWLRRSGRSWRASLDIALSVGVGQAGAMKLLKTL